MQYNTTNTIRIIRIGQKERNGRITSKKKLEVEVVELQKNLQWMLPIPNASLSLQYSLRFKQKFPKNSSGFWKIYSLIRHVMSVLAFFHLHKKMMLQYINIHTPKINLMITILLRYYSESEFQLLELEYWNMSYNSKEDWRLLQQHHFPQTDDNALAALSLI